MQPCGFGLFTPQDNPSQRRLFPSADGSRRHHQLPRRGDGGESVVAKGNELRRREKLLRVFDVVARGRAVCGRARSRYGNASPVSFEDPKETTESLRDRLATASDPYDQKLLVQELKLLAKQTLAPYHAALALHLIRPYFAKR